MSDYTELGLTKIATQARRNTDEIRCPRDGAVMRVTGGVRLDLPPEPGLHHRPTRPPLASVDVECPACRRRAERVSVEPALA